MYLDTQSNVSVSSLCLLSKACNVSADELFTPKTTANEPTSLFAIVADVVESVLGVFALFGIAANVMNCLVFYHQGLGDRMNLCLFSLALSDLMFVSSFAFLSIYGVLSDQQLFGLDEYLLKSMSYLYSINFAFRTTSGLFVMVIATERCLCVVFPLQFSSLISSRTMAKIQVFFAVLCQLGFIVQPLKYEVVKIQVAGYSEWHYVPSKLYLSNKNTIDIITYTIFSVSVPLMTFGIVSLTTFITVIKLSAAAEWRQKTSSTSIKQNNQQVALTYMLVLSSCIFIVSMMPIVLLKSVRLFMEEFSTYGTYNKLYDLCSRVASGCPVINSCVTFFIYYSKSSRYRNSLKTLCR